MSEKPGIVIRVYPAVIIKLLTEATQPKGLALALTSEHSLEPRNGRFPNSSLRVSGIERRGEQATESCLRR